MSKVSISAAARAAGIKPATIFTRMRNGQTLEEALAHKKGTKYEMIQSDMFELFNEGGPVPAPAGNGQDDPSQQPAVEFTNALGAQRDIEWRAAIAEENRLNAEKTVKRRQRPARVRSVGAKRRLRYAVLTESNAKARAALLEKGLQGGYWSEKGRDALAQKANAQWSYKTKVIDPPQETPASAVEPTIDAADVDAYQGKLKAQWRETLRISELLIEQVKQNQRLMQSLTDTRKKLDDERRASQASFEEKMQLRDTLTEFREREEARSRPRRWYWW